MSAKTSTCFRTWEPNHHIISKVVHIDKCDIKILFSPSVNIYKNMIYNNFTFVNTNYK
jgi:hypothetical protein